jgi:hypothetical protein
VKKLGGLLLGFLLSFSVAQAQITVVPINNGTGTLTSIPIPGGSNLSVTVATGSAALPLENIAGTAGATQLRLGDDSMANVPLGFTFPFYGQNFTNSWMSSNGFVSFSGNIPGAGCCGGENLATLRDPRYNYMIAGLWTDLIDTTGNATWYKGTANSMTYGWYGTKQFGTNNSNTFEININSTGALNVKFGSAFVSQSHIVTSGMTGNLANGEYYQYYHGPGFTAPTTGLTWGAPYGTGAVDMCTINPLSSPTCAGYQAAYTTQQCSISALYDPSCPGYQTAYFDQQCSLDPLYNRDCPGYANAYHDQQCSLNPLFATDCLGYAQAYHDQQCSLNALYATDCIGYAAAYLNQQCSLNQLYSTTCSGYAQAYFSQQCNLNGLYDRTCPNYGDAYAKKMVLEQQGIASTVATAGVIASTAPSPTSTTASTTSASTTISSDGSVSVGVSKTGDTNVDKAIAPPAPTTNSAAAPSAPVQLVQAPPPAAAPMGPAPAGKPEGGPPPQLAQGPQGGDSKPTQPSTREALAERRQAAAKAEAVEKGKNLANEMGKVADIESQKQIQNVVIQAMGFTPGFDNYGKVMMQDVVGYKPYSIYGGQKNVENRATLRMFGGSEKLHTEMIDSQYNKGN